MKFGFGSYKDMEIDEVLGRTKEDKEEVIILTEYNTKTNEVKTIIGEMTFSKDDDVTLHINLKEQQEEPYMLVMTIVPPNIKSKYDARNRICTRIEKGYYKVELPTEVVGKYGCFFNVDIWDGEKEIERLLSDTFTYEVKTIGEMTDDEPSNHNDK